MRAILVLAVVVVLALISTGILAFGLWVHHMFATGLPRVGYSFYTAASMSVQARSASMSARRLP